MLDRIANIELNLTRKNNKKNYSRKSFSEIYISRKIDASDSLMISPAFKLLKKYGFLIKDFNKHTSEQYDLVLEVEEFIFQLSLDAKKVVDRHELEYLISQKKELANGRIKIDILTRTQISPEARPEEQIKLEALRFLFSRCYDLEITKELNKENTFALNNLLDKIYYGILEEFTNINYVIVRFIDLVNGTKLLKKCSLNQHFNEAIFIKSIRPERTDENKN